MRKLLSAIAGFAAIVATPAIAADMAVKAPPLPPAPINSWTGWYVGGNVGYGWGSAQDALAIAQPSLNPALPLSTLAASNTYRISGVTGGAQAGYNWRVQNYLLGVEADFQGSGQKGGGASNSAFINPLFLQTVATAITESVKLDWLGTVRGRLGVANDHWIVYATGGLAYGELKTSGVAQPAPIPALGISNPPYSWSNESTKVGWTVGGGIDNALTANWSWKVEYLYIDLGTLRTNATYNAGFSCFGGAGGCVVGAGPANIAESTRFTDNIVRAGLNYHFH